MFDQIAFETVYTANVARMIHYVKTSFYSEHLDAETIVAEAFTKVWNNRETVTNDNLAGYVQRAVTTICLDAVRAKKVRPVTESIYTDAEHTTEDNHGYRFEVVAPSDHDPAVGILNTVTAVLTEDQRTAVMMRLDHSFAEIAAHMGISEDAAKKLYQRAKATMRRSFPERVAA